MATAITLTVSVPTGRERDVFHMVEIVSETMVKASRHGFDATTSVIPELDDDEPSEE